MILTFATKLDYVNKHYIARVPLEKSQELPSRGMVMIQGQLNNMDFQSPLEPDGKGSHWLDVDLALMKAGDLKVGQNLLLKIESMAQWTDPILPHDLLVALSEASLSSQWQAITSKAKWSWLRWIRATKNPETRAKRIYVACSKLGNGDKRPCCFDQTRCTITDVSKSGRLLD